MKLLLIRHGQSTNNALPASDVVTQRVPDAPLTPLGREQAVQLATFVAEHRWRPGTVWTSLMQRAVETAAALARQLGAPVQGWVDLHERPGPYDVTSVGPVPHAGLSADALRELCPSLLLPAEATSSGWHVGPIESDAGTLERAHAVLNRVASLNPAETGPLAVVSHGHFITALLMAATGVPADIGWSERVRFACRNTSVTGLEYVKGTWWILWLDAVATDPDVAGQPRGSDPWARL